MLDLEKVRLVLRAEAAEAKLAEADRAALQMHDRCVQQHAADRSEMERLSGLPDGACYAEWQGLKSEVEAQRAESLRRMKVIGELQAEVERLRLALEGVKSPARGFCWCDSSRDKVNYGHQPKCIEARAALRGGGE